MNNLTIGTKVQRKGSKVVWTVAPARAGDSQSITSHDGKRIRLQCMPKNRTLSMSNWIEIENFNKNWKVV